MRSANLSSQIRAYKFSFTDILTCIKLARGKASVVEVCVYIPSAVAFLLVRTKLNLLFISVLKVATCAQSVAQNSSTLSHA